MKSPLLAVLPLLLLFSSGERVAAQSGPPLSPRDSVFLLLDTNLVSVNYGRPSMRGRKIMGELVPWNKVWRTGANQATHFKTNYDMIIGGVPLVRGTYTLWTLPSPDGWKIILNKQTGQWGTRYDERQDYARFDALVESLDSPVDTFTIALDATGKTSGRLKLMWENTLVWTRFEKADNIRPVSPLDSTAVVLAGNSVKVRYSRPYARGRTIWGVVVPFDSVWRTGANAATVLETTGAITVGGVEIPAGIYTLYSKPMEKGMTLIVNKKGPGRAEYQPAEDLAHIELVLRTTAKTVDPFTITLDQGNTKNTAYLKLAWGDREFVADLKAK